MQNLRKHLMFCRYADDQWDFVKGQLSTVDRHYGCVHHLIHSIGTHQMHHMFTKVQYCVFRKFSSLHAVAKETTSLTVCQLRLDQNFFCNILLVASGRCSSNAPLYFRFLTTTWRRRRSRSGPTSRGWCGVATSRSFPPSSVCSANTRRKRRSPREPRCISTSDLHWSWTHQLNFCAESADNVVFCD